MTGHDIRVHIVAGGSIEVVPKFIPFEFSATTEEPKHRTARGGDNSRSGPLGVAPPAPDLRKIKTGRFFANPLKGINYFTSP